MLLLATWTLTLYFGPILMVKPYKKSSSHGVIAGISVMFESDRAPTVAGSPLGKVWVDVTENSDPFGPHGGQDPEEGSLGR